VPNPKHVVKLVRGTWASNSNAMRRTHAKADIAIGRDTAMVLRDQGQRCPGAAWAIRNSHRPSGHQMTSSGTPLRSCSASPPSMPPTRRQSEPSLSQAARKRSPTTVKWCHPASSSKAPRRMPRVGRRGAYPSEVILPAHPQLPPKGLGWVSAQA
jgi:hypothetical protein